MTALFLIGTSSLTAPKPQVYRTARKNGKKSSPILGKAYRWKTWVSRGMAGTFGHETQHLEMSKAIYASSWAKKLHGKNPEQCLATGYSCRSQIKRFAKWQPKHPVQALLTLLS